MAIRVSVVLVILVSKELLVFNAETLVLICFASFVGRVAIRGRDGVVGHFEARELQIKKDVESQRERLLKYLTEYHAVLEGNQNRVANISGYRVLYYTAVEARKEKASHTLVARAAQHVEEQFKRRATLEAKAFSARRNERSLAVRACVRSQLDPKNQQINRDQRTEDAISQLEEEGQYDWTFTPEWAEDDEWFYCCDDEDDADELSILN